MLLAELNLQVLTVWTKPRFYIDIDTLRLKGGSLDAGLHQFTLAAEGTGPSIVTSVSISDSIHWAVSGIEIGDTMQSKKLLQGELQFKGASVSGDYPVTLQIRSTPCDTVLTRTVIMSWKSSAVEEDSTPQWLTAYPIPATSLLNVEAPIGSELKLLDILGHQVISITSSSQTTIFDVRALPAGGYILVVEAGGQIKSRSVSVTR
jgi:hypothetical protein